MALTRLHQFEGPLILAIDICTSSARTIVFDRLGREVDGLASRKPLVVGAPEPGASEIYPDSIIASVENCLDRTLSRMDDQAGQIAAVACCTLVSNIIGIDSSGAALTPLYTYADARATEDAERLKAELNEREIHARTGCMLHTSYLPARFQWLARKDPGRFEAVHGGQVQNGIGRILHRIDG